MINIIVAVSENLAIGRAGDIPWHIGDDLRYYERPYPDYGAPHMGIHRLPAAPQAPQHSGEPHPETPGQAGGDGRDISVIAGSTGKPGDRGGVFAA